MTHCSAVVPLPRSRPIVGSAMVSRVLSTISTKKARHRASIGIQAARSDGYVVRGEADPREEVVVVELMGNTS
ncbi:hypothetical protein GCM10011519_19430 [Marmoricola endophyticus]|uniref:Uncharacterized protein n=1 Tax=Marmoricola endophyticus TaxID=2040280 RepID=A0A917BJI3_9ACTN|nr:hypothetical protein GCM10011519_19430 [Marmoricola endophyticus]